MDSKISRRSLVLAASSLGSAMIADGLGVLPKIGEGNAGAFQLSDAVLQSGDSGSPAKSKVLVFDVNQTLLDLNALRPHFVRVFGDGKVLDEWFALLLQYSLVVSVADAYSDFGTVGRAVLEMLASNKGVKISPEDVTRNLAGLAHTAPTSRGAREPETAEGRWLSHGHPDKFESLGGQGAIAERGPYQLF